VCPYSFLLVVLSCVPLRFSLGCPFLCALRFSLGCLFLCAPTDFSGLSARVCPYVFLWIVQPCVFLQPRENCRGTHERTTQRKPEGHTRKDNSEETVGAQKGEQSRENRKGTQERTTFLGIVYPCVSLQFFLGCPFLCALTISSGLFTLVCPYGFLWIVQPCVPLRFSMGNR
jgi:hypothetical protein